MPRPVGTKCHLCLRNKVLPVSQEGHNLQCAMHREMQDEECLRFLRSNVSAHERVQGNRYGPDPVPVSYSEHIGSPRSVSRGNFFIEAVAPAATGQVR